MCMFRYLKHFEKLVFSLFFLTQGIQSQQITYIYLVFKDRLGGRAV